MTFIVYAPLRQPKVPALRTLLVFSLWITRMDIELSYLTLSLTDCSEGQDIQGIEKGDLDITLLDD